MNPPSSRPILIITVWDAVALLWTYSIGRPPKMKCNYKIKPPRKKFKNQAAYLVKMLSILAVKITEMEMNQYVRPTAINLTFSTRRNNIKNYLSGVSIRGKWGVTKEERRQLFEVNKRAAERRVKTMKPMFPMSKPRKKWRIAKIPGAIVQSRYHGGLFMGRKLPEIAVLLCIPGQ